MEEVSETTRQRIAEALAEDIGLGDWTTEWSVDPQAEVCAEIWAKSEGVVAGQAAAAEVFRRLGGATLTAVVEDGVVAGAGAIVSRVEGRGRTILTGERTALNLLGRLSGVATLTRLYVEAVAGTGTKITDTRKTTPLWRELERAATRAGGAVNHRPRLDAMILIKENHIACAGGLLSAIRRVREANRDGIKVEVETTDLAEVESALASGVDRIMLDNMPVEMLREAVRRIRRHPGRPEIEASGGITLTTVREVAATGVDFISIGALTHSAPALDLSLRIREIER